MPVTTAKRSRPGSSSDSPEEEARRIIDAEFGLEPVFEPGIREPGAPGSSEFYAVQCPYCGESFDTLLDLSAGSASYVEDCQVCCQPIEFNLEVDHAGALVALTTLRSD
jgi:Cysteine-rich CPXCG